MADNRRERVTRETINRDDIVTIASTHRKLQCANGERAKVLEVAPIEGAREPHTGLLWELLVELEKSKQWIYMGFGDVEIVNDGVEIKDRFGCVIHRGKDLRILRNHISRARHESSKFSMNLKSRGWPVAVGLRQNKDGSGALHIAFGDCSYSDVHFENHSLMCDTVSKWTNLRDIPQWHYTE